MNKKKKPYFNTNGENTARDPPATTTNAMVSERKVDVTNSFLN